MLATATSKALDAAQKPAIALSGGLDSVLVADEVLRQIAPGQRLRSFTFRPDAAWDGHLTPDHYGDDKPFVDAFAALNSALDPAFTRNEGGGFDHRQNEMFAAMGIAPAYMNNYYVYHGVWQGAREAGCEWVFDAAYGNQTLSNDGRWSYVEHLLRLRWRQLVLTLSRRRGDPRPLWRKFASLSLVPLFPMGWRNTIRRLRHPRRAGISTLSAMIAPDYALHWMWRGALGARVPGSTGLIRAAVARRSRSTFRKRTWNRATSYKGLNRFTESAAAMCWLTAR